MKTSRDQTHFLLGGLLLFLAMAALGWTLGKGGADSPEATGVPEAEKSDRRHPSRAVRSARKRAGRARDRVDAISGGATAEQRLRSTIELANNLSPNDFAAWMDGGWFDYRGGFELTLFRRIIEERWRAEDPEGFVAWCLEEGEQGPSWATSKPKGAALPILTDWALYDPGRLRAFFAKYPDDDLEADLVARLAETNPQAALEHLGEILKRGLGNHHSYRLTSAIQELARNSPHLLEPMLADLPARVRLRAEQALVGERLKVSFESELRALYERPDGWRLFRGSASGVEGLSQKLLAELPNLPESWRRNLANGDLYSLLSDGDSEAWFNANLEGAGFIESEARKVRSTALSILSSNKPERALELMVSFDFEEKWSKRNLLSNIFTRATSNPELAAKWMGMLTNEADREIAQAILDEQEAPRPAVAVSIDQTPESWLEVAQTNQGDLFVSQRLGSAMRRWSGEEFSKLTARFRDLPDEGKDQVVAILTQNGELADLPEGKDLAGEALHHLINRELTSAESEASAEGARTRNQHQSAKQASTLAARWVLQDARAASAWVDRLPASEAKTWAQRNMAATWAQYDPAAMEQWLGGLPPGQQNEVRQFLENPSGR